MMNKSFLVIVEQQGCGNTKNKKRNWHQYAFQKIIVVQIKYCVVQFFVLSYSRDMIVLQES